MCPNNSIKTMAEKLNSKRSAKMKRCPVNSSNSDDNFLFLPQKLRDRLMPFQKDGINFALSKNGRCLIADEMGLGKTLQALSVAYFYKDEWPLLIVVPSSLRYPWIEEIERWFPEIHPHDINLIQTGGDVSGIPTSLITVVTYGLLRHPASHLVKEALINQEYKVAIVDESHYMKNRKSAGTKYLVPLLKNSHRKLLLTGTPALSRPEELFPQLESLDSKSFGTWTSFAKRYCNARHQFFGRQRRWVTDGASNLEELQYLLTKITMIRRLKKDVLHQLPPKQRQKISFELKESDLKKDLDQTWQELGKILDSKKLSFVQALNKAAGSQDNNYQQQEADNPVQVYKYISELYMKTCTAKLGPVKEYLHMLCENAGLKLLVFAHHRVMMDSITEQLLTDDIKFIRIDGTTHQQDRPGLVHQFQVDSATRVAVLSMKAAGVGLTLTAASLVVFAELDWTPGTLEQCEDRAHRIGQKGTVHVHYLVAKGTLDEWVWSALARKTAIISTTLNGKTQVLKMDDGNKVQVDCLTNADSYFPNTENSEDLADYFLSQSQQAVGQKTLLDFFTPNGSKRKKISDHEESVTEKPCKKRLTGGDYSSESPAKIVIIDSDDEDNFQKSHRKHRKKTTKGHDVSSDENDTDNDLPVLVTPKRSLSRNISDCLTAAEDVPSNWGCDRCTYLNHIALSLCEMCSSPRSKKKKGTGNLRDLKNSQDGIRNKSSQLSGKSHDMDVSQSKSDCPHNSSQRKNNKKINFFGEKSLTSVPSECGTSSAPTAKTVNYTQKSIESNETDDYFISDSQEKPPVNSMPCISDDDMESLTTIAESDVGTDTESNNALARLTDVNDTQASASSQDTDMYYNSQDKETIQSDNIIMSSSNEALSQVLNEEVAAAKLLFSPQVKTSLSLDYSSWTCAECGWSNEEPNLDCEGCLASRPASHSNDDKQDSGVTRDVNLDDVPLYDKFQYSCSKNTSRIFLLDKDGDNLQVNFIPLDIEMRNFSELPDLLLHPHNFQIVNRFVREWKSLAPTKRRLIVKSGGVFTSPIFYYEEIKSVKKSTQRYTSKAVVAAEAASIAESLGGSVRRIIRPKMQSSRKTKIAQTQSKENIKNVAQPASCPPAADFTPDDLALEHMRGITQGLDAEGNPLCVQCHRPYPNHLLSSDTIQNNPWHTRFCSKDCMEQYWMRTNRGYARSEVYRAEQGVCQLCKLNAQELYLKIRGIKDIRKRAKLINGSKYCSLSNSVKTQMAANPNKGQFWHVDHMTPVVAGGGECDIDNLRTLCTPCHHEVTAQQNKDRAKQRRLQEASKCGDITAFFGRTAQN